MDRRRNETNATSHHSQKLGIIERPATCGRKRGGNLRRRPDGEVGFDPGDVLLCHLVRNVIDFVEKVVIRALQDIRSLSDAIASMRERVKCTYLVFYELLVLQIELVEERNARLETIDLHGLVHML